MADYPIDDPSSAARGAFSALRHRDFRLYWIGACVSFVGSWVQIVAMGLFVYERTGSTEALGLVGLVGGLPTLALMLFGGAIADRVDRRRAVLLTQSLFALNALALTALTATGLVQFWHILTVSFVSGVVFAVDGPARQSIIHDMVGPEDLASGVALQSAAFNVARVLGPAIGSVLYTQFGPAWCFLTNALSFAAIIVAVLCVRTTIRVPMEPSENVLAGFAEGMRSVAANPTQKTVLLLTAATSLSAFSVYSTLMPAIAQDRLGVYEGDRRYGYLFSAIGVGALMGAYCVGRFAQARRRGALMVAGALAFSVALFLLAHVNRFEAALAIFVLIGVAAVSQLATANTLTQTLAPPGFSGRAVSLHMFAMAGMQPIGAFIAGLVAQRMGVPFALAAGASVLLAASIALLARRPAIARLP
ncbi:MAG TPA: MFS transporter [Chthonomonadales bacterium]|nr:MFS transporter [Chthonomonadales bacterium]